MEVERQITLILNGVEIDNLINLLKWAHDHGIEEPIKQECTKFLEKIQPVY
jgi:hypothetical protein